MQSSSNVTDRFAAFGLSRGVFIGLPMIVAFILFVVGSNAGGVVTDPDLRPLVWFLAIVKLAGALFVSFAVGTRCTHSRTRWAVGQGAAACMGIGAGFIGSAAAFGAGFAFFLIGVLLAALLLAKELESRHRNAGLQADSDR